jgi:DNA polymerase-3 subunit alpha
MVDRAHSYNVNDFVVHNSGAGSLVNYALGITQVNPMDYDLIFER